MTAALTVPMVATWAGPVGVVPDGACPRTPQTLFEPL